MSIVAIHVPVTCRAFNQHITPQIACWNLSSSVYRMSHFKTATNHTSLFMQEVMSHVLTRLVLHDSLFNYRGEPVACCMLTIIVFVANLICPPPMVIMSNFTHVHCSKL